MGRSRIPLVALVGAVGCTTQEAHTPSEAPQAATSPWRKLKEGLTPSESRSKEGGLRALTPEERESLLPRPLPRPEGMEAPDYAEQRRQQYEQGIREVRREAALRDAGIGPTLEELEKDETLANEMGPLDIAEQRRQQLARERLGTEEFRKFGKGGSMKRQVIRIIRWSPDGGHVEQWADPASGPTRD